ncbi:MAG: S24 family peptidase [Negativicutes bacterium]|nr:S24 family peptidase [Negativicutes bacterium]
MSEVNSGEIIEKLSGELGIEEKIWRTELSKVANINYFTLSKYTGKNARPLSKKVAETLSDFFTRELGRKITVDYLMGRDAASDPRINDVEEMVMVPVLGTVRAGKPLFAAENIIKYEPVASVNVKNGEYFYLDVTGDSMTGANIFPGGRVLVRKQDWVENSQVAVVLVGNEEATVKRIKWLDNKVILYAANSNYEPQVYDNRDIKVLGRVVKFEMSIN